jgi:hypothetical protein
MAERAMAEQKGPAETRRPLRHFESVTQPALGQADPN